MPHRSGSSRGVVLICTLLLALLHAGPAHATDVAIPAGAPTVVGPTADGVSAIAFVHGSDLCSTTVGGDQPRRATLTDGDECTLMPVLKPFGATVLDDLSDAYPSSSTYWFGVTGGEVAAVQLKQGDRVVGQADTRASPLPGAGADLRFFLVADVPGTKPDELALLDASGAVRRAVGGDQPGSPFFGGTPPAGRVLQHGRRGSAAWTLRAALRSVLSSTPLEPERRVRLACVTFAEAASIDDGFGTCDQERLRADAVVYDVNATCGPIGVYVTAIARPATRRVVVVLGDGDRRDVPLRAVPGAAPGTRAGALVVGAGVAVRRLIALGAGGRTLEAVTLQQAPAAGIPCAEDSGSSTAVFTYSTRFDGKLGSGPHTLRAIDDGPRICLAVDRAPRVPAECGLPPIDPEWSLLERRFTADGRYVVGLVPPEVTSVRLALDDGTTRDVPAGPIPGYSGQYAKLVHVVAADVPGGRHVVGYQLLDTRGRILGHRDGYPERPAPRHVTTLLRPRGLPPLRVALIPKAGSIGAEGCLAFGALTSAEDCLPAVANGYFVQADCALRRIVVLGVVRHRADRVAITTAAGREIAGDVAPLPATIGAAAGLGAAVIVVPAGSAPRRLVVRGPGAGHVDVKLPPAARQCGYVTLAQVPTRR